MVAAIQGNGSLMKLYPQYNSKRIKPIKALRRDERTAEDLSQITKKSSSLEDSITAKYQAELTKDIENKEYMSYNSLNPYGRAQQTIDESLLVGMNLDVKA
ncbi:MAG: hypothetical protein HFJ09_07780 [Lachnospiraceae bacterium]|nr:hypothetical protein [Lachnospiraceae bacterium]